MRRAIGFAAGFATVLTALLSSGAQAAAPEAMDATVGADVYEFVARVAPDMTKVRIAGGQNYERAITIGHNERAEIVVTSMQVLGKDQHAQISPGTYAIVIAHFTGQCESPYGMDGTYTKASGLSAFVAGASGKIYELERGAGAVWIRLVKGPDAFGAWEPYQEDPANYVTYRC